MWSDQREGTTSLSMSTRGSYKCSCGSNSMCGFEANEVPRGRHGIRNVPRRLEKTETVEHLQPSSLEVAQHKASS